jgi:hypothetical protein
MTKRLAILLLTLSAFGFAIAGCGGDDEDDKATPKADTPVRTTATEDEAATSEEDGAANETGGAPPAAPRGNPEDVRNAQARIAEACKKRYRSQGNASPSVLEALELMCDKGAARDREGVREANKEVCRRIVRENAPAETFGSGREAALRLCDQR